MLTIDTLRSALAASDPFEAMDRLVRAELAGGRTTADIYDELWPTVKQVRESGGLTADAREALTGTLDALTGDCDPDQVYQDPPTIPAESEIATLPRWARVAYAARCARRVLPLFAHNWPNAPTEYNQRLHWMVAAAEQAAELGTEGDAPLSPTTFAVYACDAVFNSNRDHRRVAEVLTVNRSQVARLPEASVDLVACAVHVCAYNSAVAAAHAITDGRDTYPAALSEMTAVFRADFMRLQEFATNHNWTDETTVPPSSFGPLWPAGAPRRWPIAERETVDVATSNPVGELVS